MDDSAPLTVQDFSTEALTNLSPMNLPVVTEVPLPSFPERVSDVEFSDRPSVKHSQPTISSQLPPIAASPSQGLPKLNVSESLSASAVTSDSDASDLSSSDVSSTSASPASLTPVPRLYGDPLDPAEVVPTKQDQSAAPAPDPLDDMTDADWLALIEPVSSSPFLTSAQPHSERTAAQPVAHNPTTLAPATLQNTPLTLASPPAHPAHSPPSFLTQLTSVAQLSDVQPTDWAYEALRSLVERYGAIAGFPDSTFRGSRALTRYEFAAALNAALDNLAAQIQPSEQDAWLTLERLRQEFAPELASLGDRLEGLEPRVANLERTQFSTTVRLNGEVVLGLADAGGGNPPGLGEASPVFTQLTQLQLSASFTGRDAFRLGLSASNFGGRGFAEPTALNTNMALLGYQSDSENQINLDSLEYRFAVGDRLVFTLKPVGFALTTVLSPNSIFSSSSQGAISRFAAFNPVLRTGSLDAGVGVDVLLTNRARLQLAYGARHAGDSRQGFFASDQRAFGAQLLTRPFRNVTAGFAYVNAFSADGSLYTFTGSNNADTSGGFGEPAAIHAVSGTLQWRVTPGLVFGTWGGVFVTDSLASNAAALSTTFQFSLAFPDAFGRQGDLAGIIIGQPPRLRIGTAILREDEGSGMHYEAFYRFRVNDHLTITPGFFVVTHPGHIEENNTIFVGAVRATLSF